MALLADAEERRIRANYSVFAIYWEYVSRIMSSLSDSELLKRYVADADESAFKALVERHLPVVYGVVLRHLHNPSVSQEVAQNAFIAVAKRALLLTAHRRLVVAHASVNLGVGICHPKPIDEAL